MTLDWQTIKDTYKDISKEDFFNLFSNKFTVNSKIARDKIFKDFCFLKEIQNELNISEDFYLYFGFSDKINTKDYEFDTLFYLSPNKNHKKRKKIIVNIEFHDARNEVDSDNYSLEECFEEKIKKSTEYFFNLLNDHYDHYLDFYFFYKKNEKNIIRKKRISLLDKETMTKRKNITNKISYNNFSSEENIESFFKKSKIEAMSINILLDAIKHKKDKKILEDFLSKFFDENSNKKYFVFNGEAGSGKTVLAFQIKEFLEKEKGLKVFLQIINQNFCKIIKSKIDNYKNISFHTDEVIEKLESNEFDVLIIDEAQRLEPRIFEYFSPNLKIILLGDHMQRISCKDKFDMEQFCKGTYYQKKVNTDFIEEIYLKKSRRFNHVNFKWIKYIFYNTEQEPKKKDIDNFKINNFHSEQEFILKFRESNCKTKCFTSLQFQSSSQLKFSISSLTQGIPNKEYFLERPSLYENYVFAPFDIISNEVDSNFIYLPYEFIIKENGSKIEFLYSLGKKEYIDFYIRQYWVLLTRARQSLYFYAANPETRKYLEKKCNIYNNVKQ